MKDLTTTNAIAGVFTVIPMVPDPAPVAPIAVPAPPSAIDEKIEVWFAKHFHNLGALLDERMHNIIHAAKEDLKAELAKL